MGHSCLRTKGPFVSRVCANVHACANVCSPLLAPRSLASSRLQPIGKTLSEPQAVQVCLPNANRCKNASEVPVRSAA